MRILVVDDEKLLVKGVKFNLENEGYEVECAYDGASAVELARNGRFDLIILDVMMPELDGQEACMRIREFSNVPIIMLTAKSEDADKLMGFECGADDYVTKPFNILELKARVRALLRRAAGTQRNRGAVLTAGDLSLNTEAGAVVKALLEGTEEKDWLSAIPEGFQVTSVRLEESTCYVDLPTAALPGLPEGADLSLALRALADSLLSLRAVEEVRYLVDGEFASAYGGAAVLEPYLSAA